VGMIIPFYSERLQVGRIQIPFDTSVLASGASTVLTYTLQPLDSVASAEPVPSVTDEPQILCADGTQPADGGVDAQPPLDADSDAGMESGVPEGSASASPGPTDGDHGCGCRTAPRRSADAWWLTLLFGLSYGGLSRRRRRPDSSRLAAVNDARDHRWPDTGRRQVD
jgi:hypothetical protein